MVLTQQDREYYNRHKESYPYIISICTPDDDITPLHNYHAVYKFWDVDHVMENKFRRYAPPSPEDALRPVRQAAEWFIKSYNDHKDFTLLVHCDMGISRSAAVSLGILWRLSGFLFNPKPEECIFRHWLDARKEWCANQVDDDQSITLKRYIQGRYNPGVKPNQAILKIYGEAALLPYFPW